MVPRKFTRQLHRLRNWCAQLPNDTSARKRVHHCRGVHAACEVLQDRRLLTFLQTLSPADAAVDVEVETDLILSFDGDVLAGSGDLIIRRFADNSVFHILPVTSTAVTIAGSEAVIDLPGNLEQGTEYFVQIEPGAITDSTGNPVNGIDGPFSWRFQTMTDLSVVPFWDGDATFPTSESPLYNLFGGPVVASDNVTVSHETLTVRSGSGAIRADVLVGESDFGFFGPALAGFGTDSSYVDTRDITPFERFEFQLKNDTGTAFQLRLELKDFRDLSGGGNAHRAVASFSVSADPHWQSLSVPLDLADAVWQVTGTPDLSRARQILFVIEAGPVAPLGGTVFIDEAAFVEPGGPKPLSTLSDQTLLAQLAERSFRSLWGTRDRSSGLVPAISTFADQMGLNTTAMLVRSLPGAVQRAWVTRAQAEAYVTTLTTTLNSLMDAAQFLPPRTVDRVTLQPVGLREESSVDAAFMFLSLTTFQAMPGLNGGLASNIEVLLDRFDFRPFSSPNGWRFAFRYDDNARTGTLTDGTYDGYSGEVQVISLAAHLAQTGHVDITTQFHSADRVLTDLGNGLPSYMVHPSTEFRSPFLQWLFPIFVDVKNRGQTTHPNPDFALNPYTNAVRYQQDVIRTFASQGLPLQPDAADDGSGNRYITPSAFQQFGNPDLTMPWSAGFVFAADPAVAAAQVRTWLQQSLVGPFGPVDSARVNLQSGDVTTFNGRYDLWNSALWLSSISEFLYSDNSLLTTQPAVDAALNRVFTAAAGQSGDVDGDGDFDANDSFLIHLVQLAGTDAQIDQSKGSSQHTAAQIRNSIDQLNSAADVDGDEDFDANDSFLIHLVKLAGTDSQINQSKGNSQHTATQIRAAVAGLEPSLNDSFITSPLSAQHLQASPQNAQPANAAAPNLSGRTSQRTAGNLFFRTVAEPKTDLRGTVDDGLPVATSATVMEQFRQWIDIL
ncbi:MAG: Ig-like domain-containing protein [Fuerstiella sp.]